MGHHALGSWVALGVLMAVLQQPLAAAPLSNLTATSPPLSNLTAISSAQLGAAAVADAFTTSGALSPPPARGGLTMAADELTAGESCKLSGHVDECCNCTYQDVDRLNAFMHPLLGRLVRTAFFRYFKVNIYCDCPLWPDDSMCHMRACSVCECDASEVPAPWREQEEACGAHQCGSCQAGTDVATRAAQPAGVAEMDSRVNSTVDPDTAVRLLNLKGWRGFNNPWMAEADGGQEEYLYVNLLINPERYTGYTGEHAHRIWNAIYSQSCFRDAAAAALSPSPAPSPDPAASAPFGASGPALAALSSGAAATAAARAAAAAAASPLCPERRIFYRLISGMHASISAHISAHYLLDEERGQWGHNLTDFRMRLGTPQLRDRVQNLYFAYLFVLRAVVKAAPLLARYQYVTGVEEEDAAAAELMRRLVSSAELQSSCPMPFDEGRLWKGADGLALREELRAAFVNITRIMDCVGCEKCKLWGKLQTLGVATALKVLFSSSDCSGALPTAPALSTLALERNEVIALLNLLERFSASIEYYRQLSAELQAADGAEGARPAVDLGEPVS